MELNTSAITGALRVGVQVIVARKRPVVEIYPQLRHQFGPEEQYELPMGVTGRKTQTMRHRRQYIFIDLTLVNIGGERATDVSFEVEGEFRRSRGGGENPEIFSKVIKQFSPGQSIYLMKIDQFDLLEYEYSDEDGQKVEKSSRIKNETLSICLHYDGPDTIINRLLRWPRRWRKLKQYSTDFVFDPQIYQGDLPPADYA